MEDIKEYFADKPHLKLRIWKDEYNLPVYEVRSRERLRRQIIAQIYKDGNWVIHLRRYLPNCRFFYGNKTTSTNHVTSFDKFTQAADYVNKKILKEQDK